MTKKTAKKSTPSKRTPKQTAQTDPSVLESVMPQPDQNPMHRPALITGFPGFLATRLLNELLPKQPDTHFTLLVQPTMLAAAEQKRRELLDQHPEFNGLLDLVPGDITHPTLGLDPDTAQKLYDTIGLVWHLAAIYDLAVPETLAWQVNVGGTNHILDFCERLQNPRLNYISTCYVSGSRQGRILESELDEGQSHQNHYESTKFWAEMEVRRRQHKIPTAILRPAIVVGDSRTGATAKYDGPYFLIQLIHRLPRHTPIPRIGRGQTFVNLVPSDFVTQAIAHIGLKPDAIGTFHLADPNPMRAKDITDLILHTMGRRPTQGILPLKLVLASANIPLVEDLLKLPKEVINYFAHNPLYDTTEATKALADTSITCPHLSTYMSHIVNFYQENPHL